MNWWTRPSEWNDAAASPADPLLTPRSHRYFAFLSYSHKDEAIASWLHRALEQFRVPPSLAGRLTEQGVAPKRLTPVFRDRHELAAADDLGAEIRTALGASQFLIVLCSPAAAKSKWTNAEVDAFKRTRPDGCVIAAIVDGEPFASDSPGREGEECFPPALRNRYDRRGRPTSKRAEPLAADLRDDRDGRRLGLLKIVAAMLGVGLDDLVQRDHLRRQRRLGFIAAGSIAGMLITSSLAVAAITARNEAHDQRREAEGLVGFMLGDLKEKLEPLGRLDVLDSVGTRALAYYRMQNKAGLSDEALAQRSKALTLIGEIANARGDLSSALSRYREALAGTAEAVRRNPDNPQRLFDHAQNVFWVGYIAWQRGEASEATARMREYKLLADRMVALVPDNNNYRLEQVYADTNLGTVLLDDRQFGPAVQAFQGSLRAAEAIAAAEPRNLDYQKQLSEMLAWLADAQEKSGALEQALASRERQLRLLQELSSRHPRDTYLQRSMMTAYRGVGRLLGSRGDAEGGIRQALRGVAISELLFSIEPENTEWLQANASGRFDLADLQLALNRPEAAASSVRAGCDIADRLIRRDPTVADWRSLLRSRCMVLRARVALAEGSAGEGAMYARYAVAAAGQAAKPLDRRVSLMQTLSVGSTALDAAGRGRDANEWARKGLEAAPALTALTPNELADVVLLEIRSGNRSRAQQIAARLEAMGYRHPDYIRARTDVRRT